MRYLLLLPLLMVLSCTESLPPADVIYQGGSIVTMAGEQPQYVEAVATQGDQIVAIGTRDEILRRKGEATKIVELDGKTMLPGFVEPHLHPLLATLLIQTEIIAFNDWDLPHGNYPGSTTAEAYWAKLEAAVAKHDHEVTPFISWGFHEFFHGNLTREELDEKFPDVPVIIWQYSFHEIIFNTAAIEQLKVDKVKAAAHPQVDFKEGRFFETGMHTFALPKLIPYLLNPAKAAVALAKAAKAVEAGGITTVADMAMPLVNFNLEHNLAVNVLNNDSVDFRTIMIPNPIVIMGGGTVADAFAQIDTLDRLNTDKVTYVKHIKLLADGAFYAQLMRMTDGYLDGHHGEWMTDPEVYKALADHFWDAGYQIHVHVNGDAGMDFVLDHFDEMQQRNPRTDHRSTLQHMGFFREDQADRMKSLEMAASVQPFYTYAMGEKYSEHGLGPERAERISATGDLVSRGINTSLHSDFFMAPAEPLTLAWCAVNRMGISGKVMRPDLGISVWEAMKAVTINAAWQLQMEDQIGTIEVGKKADFVILGEDPFKIDPMKLKDVEVVGTVFEGKN